jgi:MarR family transcriptional regulator, temperature-dependent positive regulator of motility
MFDECLYFNTTALARRLEQRWAGAFKPLGLTPPQAFLLRAVLNQPGMPQRELAQTMAVSRPTATRALDGLAEKRFIERVPSTEDGREMLVYPTRRSLEIERALNEASGKITRQLKVALGEDVFEGTVNSVRSVRSAIG